ncbi:elongation factor 1-gamma 2-like [Bidens hawaiensis]|uniref:elongation factor 1-gamma 2-like n=1 Tax=Bidens hawaiensis TaxID=980011 RepID=UPI004049590C
MALVMHVGKPNKNALKILIAAEYVGVDVKCPENFEMGVSNKTPEFLNMNPFGKVPVLETPDGVIFESNAITRYVARLNTDIGLFGSSPVEYGQIEQWIDFASMEIDLNLLTWLRQRIGLDNYVSLIEEASVAALKRALDALNIYLTSHTFLVGDAVTLADIIMTCNLYSGFKFMMTKSFTSEFPHVERYFWTMVNQLNFRKIIGELKQTEIIGELKHDMRFSKTNAYAKPKIVETNESSGMPKEEDIPNSKAKNLLDLLPPSKIILDDWKRLYSNTKSNFLEIAVKGFWEMFDPEGYSLWFCEYKYNNKNSVSSVTMNKVGGFLQRMDLARKYAFGKMLIVGNKPPFKVKGMWLFRGLDIPKFVMDECYDMELYEWTKVDPSDEVQKERVNQMIKDHNPIEGEALLYAKCFK